MTKNTTIASAAVEEPYQKKAIQLLETEIHYLSLALKKLPKYAPEHTYLERKVSTAKSELEALYEDVALTADFHGATSDEGGPYEEGGERNGGTDAANNIYTDTESSWQVDRPVSDDTTAVSQTRRKNRRRPSSNHKRGSLGTASIFPSRRRTSDLSAKSAISAMSTALSRSKSGNGKRRSSLLSLRNIDAVSDDDEVDYYDNSDVYLFQDDGDSGSFSMYEGNDFDEGERRRRTSGSVYEDESADERDGKELDYERSSCSIIVVNDGGSGRKGRLDDEFYDDGERGNAHAHYQPQLQHYGSGTATGSSFSGSENLREYSAVDILQAPMPHQHQHWQQQQQQQQREQQTRQNSHSQSEQRTQQYAPLPHQQHQPHPLQSYHDHIQQQQQQKKKRQKQFYLFFVALSLLVTLLCAYFLIYRENKLKIFRKGKISTAGINIGQNHKHSTVLEGEGGDPCALFMVYIQLDRYGNETSWEILQLLDVDNGGSSANVGDGTGSSGKNGSGSGESHSEQHRQHIQQQQKNDEVIMENTNIANHVEVASNAQENENSHLSGSGRGLLSSLSNSFLGNFRFRWKNKRSIGNNGEKIHSEKGNTVRLEQKDSIIDTKVENENSRRKAKSKTNYNHNTNPLLRFLRRLPSKLTKPQRGNGIVLLSGGPYAYLHDEIYSISDQEKTIMADVCLPIGKYQFILYDSAQNGICCQHGRGKYQLKLANGDHDHGRIVRPMSKGNFEGEMEVTEFLVGFDDFGTDDAGDATDDNSNVVTASSSEIATSSSMTTHIPDDYDSANEQEEGLVNVNENDSDDVANNDEVTSSQHSGSSPSSAPIETNEPPSNNNIGFLPSNPSSTTTHSIPTSLTTVPNQEMPSLKTSKAYGILFEVETFRNSNPIAITGMDLYLLDINKQSSTAHYEVWYKKGSWRESDYGDGRGGVSNKGFRKVSHGEVVGAGGCSRQNDGSDDGCVFSSIPEEDFESIILGGKEVDSDVEYGGGTDGGESFRRITFWVTLTTNGLIVQDGEVDEDEVIQSSNQDLTVYFGESVHVYPLQLADPQTDFHEKKGFIGRLRYKEISKK